LVGQFDIVLGQHVVEELPINWQLRGLEGSLLQFPGRKPFDLLDERLGAGKRQHALAISLPLDRLHGEVISALVKPAGKKAHAAFIVVHLHIQKAIGFGRG
jgi:hypothetical protein